MGDRANVFIQTDRDVASLEWDGIGVYAHWAGTSLHNAALAALPKAMNRRGDPSYFARIIVHNCLVAVADPNEETGAGLWTKYPDDNEHPILVLNAETGEHWYANEETFRYDQKED
jgi:hypothetical protein